MATIFSFLTGATCCTCPREIWKRCATTLWDANEFNYHGVKVFFSDKADTADQEIVKLLNRSDYARDTVVVTNDNQLRRDSKRAGAQVTSIEEFKRHMKNLFRVQHQAHREPLEKFEGVPKSEVDLWLQEFGITEPDPDDGESDA